MKNKSDFMRLAIVAAEKELNEEKFKQAVEVEKTRLRWPWYKRLCPYRVSIKIIDLRKE